MIRINNKHLQVIKMRIFISGGCKSGKSIYAQRLAKSQNADLLYYIATMNAADGEDQERIIKHQAERAGWGFITQEQPCNIANILTSCNRQGSFLLDSLTALLANEMFPPAGEVDENAPQRVATELTLVLQQIERIVIVSDYIYADALLFDPLTTLYRQSLAELDRVAAQYCDVVLEAAYTQVIVHKGADIFSQVQEVANEIS